MDTKKAGIIVLLGDFFKAAIVCILARVIGTMFFPDIMYPMILWGGLGVVLGHNFPFYMNFKGGKGIAATAGVIFGTLDWRLWLICLFSFIICVAITRYVSLGSLIVVTLLFLSFMMLGMTGNIMNPVTDTPYAGADLTECYVVLFLFAALAFERHKANIGRLIRGEENKIFSKKPELEQTEK